MSHRQSRTVSIPPAPTSAFSSSSVMGGDPTLPCRGRGEYGRPPRPMVEPEVIAASLVPELGPLEGLPAPLSGGITNRNFRLRMGGEDLVLRICDPSSEVLGIDRETEEIASRRAAAAHLAPPVVAFLPDVPALVTRWLPGGTVAADALRT